MDFEKELKKRAAGVNEALDRLVPTVRAYPGIIHEALRYSLFAGGKRLRPVLALAAAEVMGGCCRDIMPAACSLELIHTYSLIHDDLPAMDNDDLRRGMPTCHKKYGEAIALLAGDALLTRAFELISMCPVNKAITPERLIKVVSEISGAAGTGGLIGGQVVDIISSSRNMDAGILEYIHKNKTGALYRVSVRTGVILSGSAGDDLERLTQYADHLGLAFQITDDILDLVGDEKSIGKPVRSDLKNEKATYPSLYGMEKALLMSEEEMEKALEAIEVYDEKADFLRELVKFVVKRNH
ncbi:MAG: polyprenyl synthetase family protein [Actinobacteria bacterium]|nr:polyprenyl synthetase family protein [Actinomycetota bacterium]